MREDREREEEEEEEEEESASFRPEVSPEAEAPPPRRSTEV